MNSTHRMTIMKWMAFPGIVFSICLSAGILSASMYSECVLKACVQDVNDSPRYDTTLKSHVVTVTFKIAGVIRGGGFLPVLCNDKKGKTYTGRVLLPDMKSGKQIRKGAMVRLKYTSGSGSGEGEMVTWENWKLITK